MLVESPGGGGGGSGVGGGVVSVESFTSVESPGGGGGGSDVGGGVVSVESFASTSPLTSVEGVSVGSLFLEQLMKKSTAKRQIRERKVFMILKV